MLTAERLPVWLAHSCFCALQECSSVLHSIEQCDTACRCPQSQSADLPASGWHDVHQCHCICLPGAIDVWALHGVLQGQRAARIEMLLAHEFHARKFMLPDKLSFRDRERLQRAAGGDDDEEAPAAGGELLHAVAMRTGSPSSAGYHPARVTNTI